MTTEKEYHPSRKDFEAVTIANGQTLSAAIDLSGLDIAGIFIPTEFDGSTLYIQAAPSLGGTYGRVQAGGVDLALTVAAGKPCGLENLAPLAGWQFIKLEAGTAQTGDSVLHLALRPV